MRKADVLEQLVAMSRWLGDASRDLVILDEGNTSAKVTDQWFYVKASGTCLGTATPDGFVEVSSEQVLEMLDAGPLTDEEIAERFERAKRSKWVTGKPCLDTVMHAYLLSLGNLRFVGHTHPTEVNKVLCAQASQGAVWGRILPDEVVYCGVAPAYVEYVDPGLPVARAVRGAVQNHQAVHGDLPKVILLENHGLVALGGTPEEVQSVTTMWVKTARILVGAYALGGPRFLTEGEVRRLWSRPDQRYRLRGMGRPRS